MVRNSSGTQNQPLFADTGAPDLAVDSNEVSNFAALVGNRKVGTAAARDALVSPNVWEGLEWFATDQKTRSIYLAGAWVLWDADTGWLDVVFAAGWSSYTVDGLPPVKYRRVTASSLQRVTITGVPVKTGGPTAGETMFTLPTGARPAGRRQFTATPTSVSVYADGTVKADSASTSATVSLGEITFTLGAV